MRSSLTAAQPAEEIEGITVVLPCLNEQATIGDAVEEARIGLARAGAPGEVLVVDNGSNDQSVAMALAKGARVIHARVRGYGAAIDAGIRQAKYPIVVFADADLSYPLIDLNLLIQPLVRHEAEFVLGSRVNGRIESGAIPWLNLRLGTPLLSLALRWIHALPISDCNSGMRAVRKADYESLKLRANGMEYASEQLVRVAAVGLRYREVAIDFRKDRRGRPSHLRRWRDGLRHLRCIFALAPVRARFGMLAIVAGALLLAGWVGSRS